MLKADIDDRQLKALLDNLIRATDRIPQVFATLFKQRIQRNKSKLLAGVRSYPENLPDLPFVWSLDPVKQARARRWYFANKVPRGSRGGRYQRTGALARSWQLHYVVTPNAGIVSVSTEYPGAAYVMGSRQVPSHIITGWPTVGDATLEASDLLEQGIEEDWNAAIEITTGIS